MTCVYIKFTIQCPIRGATNNIQYVKLQKTNYANRILSVSPGRLYSRGLIFGRMFELVYRGAYIRRTYIQEGLFSGFCGTLTNFRR